MMDRIIYHWTAGSHKPSNLDKGHYHYLIDGDGAVHLGSFPVAANAKPVKGKYAAHTLNCNTGSIGVAVCAMAGAVERPFDAGRAPITPAQVKALAALLRELAKQYKIPVTRQTVLSHAEVQPTLGIRQRGKWDIAWLPGMKAPGDPVAVGDKIRAMVTAKPAAAANKPVQRASAPKQTTPAKEGAKAAAGGVAGAVVVLVAYASDAWAKFVAFADWIIFWTP
jgi:N-acetyl-anhydromuramyl-L-alanine amidase AmpD